MKDDLTRSKKSVQTLHFGPWCIPK